MSAAQRRPKSILSTCEVVQIRITELVKSAKLHSLPDSSHHVKVEADVVVRSQHRGKYFSGVIKMPDVGARIAPADRASAFLVQRPRIFAIARILDVDPAAAGEVLA